MTVTILRMAELIYRHGQYHRQSIVTSIYKNYKGYLRKRLNLLNQEKA